VPSKQTTITHETDKDEDVCDECGRRELRQVADHGQRQEDHQLNEDQQLDWDQLLAISDREDEGLQVLRNENGVRSDEANLRQEDRKQDGEAHPLSVQLAANAAEAAWYGSLGFAEQEERVERDHGDEDERDC